MSQLSHAQFPLRRHPNLLVDHRRSRSAAVAEPRGANGEAVTGSGGRLHFGMVAGIKSERWPTSNRNPRPDCLGIRIECKRRRCPDVIGYPEASKFRRPPSLVFAEADERQARGRHRRSDAISKSQPRSLTKSTSRSDRILERRPSLSRSGVRARALDHGAHAVRALWREMLLQTQRAKGAQGVDGKNLLWRPIGEKRDRDRDQPANDVRVAVAAIMQDHLAVGARSRLAFQPYLTDAAPHLVAFIVGRLT